MFLNVSSLVTIFLGLVIFLGASQISDVTRHLADNKGLAAPKYRSLLYVWPTRVMGIILICFGIWSATSGPPRSMMGKDKNRIVLLENGKIISGEVVRRFYQHLAPAGWKVIYKFQIEDLSDDNEETYWGSIQGPFKYYTSLSKGDPITIIYYPVNPKINCEIRCFLNNPSYRKTFKKAGKFNLLEKFSKEYKIENYTYKEWYNQQQTK